MVELLACGTSMTSFEVRRQQSVDYVVSNSYAGTSRRYRRLAAVSSCSRLNAQRCLLGTKSLGITTV